MIFDWILSTFIPLPAVETQSLGDEECFPGGIEAGKWEKGRNVVLNAPSKDWWCGLSSADLHLEFL